LPKQALLAQGRPSDIAAYFPDARDILKHLEDYLPDAPAKTSSALPSPTVREDVLYLDVRQAPAGPKVLAWVSVPSMVRAQRLDSGWGDVLQVDSADQLQRLLPSKRVVVSVGDALPTEWETHIKSAGVRHVLVSDSSPKQSIDAHISAAEPLTRGYDPATTRIFDALPREATLIDDIESLGLRRDQADGWRKLAEERTAVQSETQQRLEEPRKSEFLHELRAGTSNVIVLFAHSQYGSIRLLGGESITPEELEAVGRDKAPPRAIVLVSCDAGTVNRQTEAIAEILLRKRLAQVVIAPPGPVSAAGIPDMLRRFLNGDETLDQVFNSDSYRAISMRLDPGKPPEVATSHE
jgi:hypothetical protein